MIDHSTGGDYKQFEIDTDENIKNWVNTFKYVLKKIFLFLNHF